MSVMQRIKFQPFSKMDKLIFLKILHTIYKNVKLGKKMVEVLANLLKVKKT